MSISHGFELMLERRINETGCRARMYKHVKTGAELMSLCLEDENKVFGVSFRTPPKDSTGVAHILEHSVLCGSEKYPVKEPFVELLKGSLQTFLNAFTYPDKTCYPVASVNLKDFHNLIDVYLDAVFFPRISEMIFRQEGWRMEPESSQSPDSSLAFKGVVFNEMKGAYSSPDNLLYEYVQHSLFPDNVYGLDSGGDPERIPDLTYEQFKRFHQDYYHPSNARFFFYGDDPEESRLALLEQWLDRFEPKTPDSEVSPQPAFDLPRKIIRTYAVDPEQDEAKGGKSMTTLNWLLPETLDASGPVQNYLFHMLEHILVGMPASPLRKRLMDSGLGEDLTGVGLEADLRQMYFSTGLKGVEQDKTDQVEGLVMDTLRDLAENGLSPELVEAAVNTIEFELRENNTGRFPRGLQIMVRALTTWLYDKDPLALVGYEEPLSQIKARLQSGEKIFENMIQDYFLDNNHRTLLVMTPDPGLGLARAAREKERLDSAKAELDQAGLEELARRAAELKQAQERPDSPEALASIPRLGVADLDKENKLIPIDELACESAPLFYHDIETNGVAYLDLGFDLSPLDQSLLPLIPVFGRCLLEMGTKKESYVDLGMRIARKTGGVYADEMNASVYGGGPALSKLFLRSKAAPDKVEDLADILRDVLLIADFDNKDRFKQIVLEEKARAEQRLIPSGHLAAASRIGARFSQAGRLAEEMGGVSQIFFLRQLAEELKSDWPGLRNKLESIREKVILRDNLILNATLSGKEFSGFEKLLPALVKSLPQGVGPAAPRDLPRPPHKEALAIPAQVNYVGKGANLYELGYEYHGSAGVTTKHLRTGLLWDRIRVQGGAYGAMCMFDRVGGTLALVSYRDPNLERTLDVYDRIGDYLAGLELDQSELTKAIIGAINDMDAYLLPDAKGFASLARRLTGDTEEIRARIRQEILSTTTADMRRMAQALRETAAKGAITVLGGGPALEQTAKEKGWDLRRAL